METRLVVHIVLYNHCHWYLLVKIHIFKTWNLRQFIGYIFVTVLYGKLDINQSNFV